MSEEPIHLAVFDNLDPAVAALDKLRELGISDQDMAVISGVPFTDKMLGRPPVKTTVPLIGAAGAFGGLVIGLIFNFGTPLLYPNYVGRQPLLPIPTAIVVTFEMIMLGLLVATFMGVIWESSFPKFGKLDYHAEISNGKIAITFRCPPEKHTQMHEEMNKLGATWTHRTEANVL